MTHEHPINPSPELVQEWLQQGRNCISEMDGWKDFATQAARWGSDQELEACCEWIYKLMDRGLEWSIDLRASRRPKPPSLKERALQAMDRVDVIWATDEFGKETMDDIDAIRRALESLPD